MNNSKETTTTSNPNIRRRRFLKRGAQALVAMAVGGKLIAACDERYPTGLRKQRGILTGTNVYYPEDFGLDPNNTGPAINAALEEAALTGGVVELGKTRTEYKFASDIWLRNLGSTSVVTLRGTSRSIILRNIGGTGSLGPAMLHIHKNGLLQALRVSGAGYALASSTKGVNSGADLQQLGTADFWTIENCEIDSFPYSGINFGDYTNNCTVQNSIIHGNGDAGIQIGRHSTFNSIYGNTAYSNGKNGIDCNGDDNTLTLNECYGNGGTGSTDRNGIFVGGVSLTAANRNKIRYNTCHNNDRAGILSAVKQCPTLKYGRIRATTTQALV